MEYRNIIYYLVYIPTIFFFIGFPFYFGIPKSNIEIIFYLTYLFLLTFILIYIQKKYWSRVLKNRKKKIAELLKKKYEKVKILEDNQYFNLEILNKNVLLKFDFSNYPPHRFSVPKNSLKIYIEKSELNKNDKKLKVISINNYEWIYENKKHKVSYMSRSLENLVQNSEKEIQKLINKAK